MKALWMVSVVTALGVVSCGNDDSSPAQATGSGGAASGGTAGAGGGSTGGMAGVGGATGGSAGAGGSANCAASGISKGPWSLAAQTTTGTLRWEACTETVSADVTLTPEGGGAELPFTAKVTPFVVNNRYSSLIPLTVPDDLPGTYYMHEVALSDLAPGTCYQYELAAESGRGGRFCTAAAGPGDFKFVAIGDTNPGLTPRIADAIGAAATRGFDFSLHAGDIQYYDSGLETWASWFPLMTSLLSEAAFFPSIGNHEFEKPDEFEQYVARFFGGAGFDGNDRYYRFEWRGVWFFALDTEGTISDQGDTTQYDWFEAQLADAAARPDYRFSVVFYHRPMLTCGDSGQQDAERVVLEPLFEQHGVRLAIQGHMHGYERFDRTLPGGAPLTYITTAGGGGAIRDPSENIDRPDCVERSVVSDQYHVTHFDLTGTTLTGRALGTDGQVLDEFGLTVP